MLRTGFEWLGNEQPLQLVYKQAQIVSDQQDWRGLSAQEQEDRFQKYLKQDRERGFEISEPPLMRLALFDMTEAHHRCLWTFHHAILDGRSFTIILKELFSIYDARCENKSWSAAVPRPYQEYIQWLQQNSLEDAKAFWQRSLQGFSDPNSLSFGFPDVDRQGYGEQKTRLSAEITKTLQTLARAHELTTNTILQGAWAILLSHYTGENEIVFGTTRAGRHFPVEGAESMVGLFINTLPVHVKLSPETRLLDLLRSIREQLITSRPYEHTPLHKIQEWSDVPRESVLFENILVFENYLLNTSLQNQGGKWAGRECRLLERTGFPLTLAGYANSELLLNIEYELARFDDRTMTSLLCHLQDLLTFMATEGLRGTLSDIPLVGAREKHQLLIEWNRAHSEHRLNGCIHELFESQVRRTPDAIAVSSEKSQLTYQELNQRANQLARYLHGLGAGPETIIGICMERSVEMMVGLLGILKAGAAYLPFDPTHPQDRLLHALQDSQSPVLLTHQNLLSNLPGYKGQRISLDSDWPGIAREETSNPNYDVQDRNLAYVIYTSGSTGKPKGVMVEHRALVRFTEAATVVYQIGPQDRVLQFASISFDASAEEIYTTLTQGATLVLRSDDMLTSAGNFLRKCEEWNLTVLDLPTAYWQQLTGELNRADAKFPPSLRLTIIGGEKAQTSAVTEWFRHAPRSIRLVNTYGPTEATIVATVYEFSADLVLSNALIGRPLENTEVYILDQYLQPVPIGVGGELYIGGESLARGYLHQEQLTAEKFIANPFSNQPGARLYKTGDRARYHSDGNIEFLGRLDQQVKIRGFRIELGEIEAVLGSHPAIRENVVMAHEEQPGDIYLVTYFVPDPNTPFNRGELRSFLRETLPDYMIPAVFVELEHLPLTQSGKINRRALPLPDRSRSSSEGQFVAPRDEVEKSITAIMANVLNLNQVGVYDNFFDLGGHSLLAMRVLARVNEKFAIHLSLMNFFVSPTVAGLSEGIKTILWATQGRPTISDIADGEREEIEL